MTSHKLLLFTLSMLTLTALACNAAMDPVPAATEAPAEATEFVPPPESVPAFGQCPTAGEGQTLYRLDDAISGGYCFLFPSDFVENNTAGHGIISLQGPTYGGGQEPSLAFLNIYTDTPAGMTLEQLIDKRVSDMLGGGSPDLPVTVSTMPLDVESARLVYGMPGRLQSRTIFVIHSDVLYVLVFSPDEPELEPAPTADMQRLFDMVTSSWVFQQ